MQKNVSNMEEDEYEEWYEGHKEFVIVTMRDLQTAKAYKQFGCALRRI